MCNFSMLIYGKFSLKVTRSNTLTKIITPTIDQCWASVYLIDMLTLVNIVANIGHFFYPSPSAARWTLSASMSVCLSTGQWNLAVPLSVRMSNSFG